MRKSFSIVFAFLLLLAVRENFTMDPSEAQLLFHSENSSDFHMAAVKDQVAILQMSINDLAIDPNVLDDAGKTALHYAAECGNKASVEALIAASADPKIADNNKYTPLHYAAELYSKDSCSIIASLLDAGALVNTQNGDGNTPLHLATPYPDVVQLLVERGAEKSLENNAGKTAQERCQKEIKEVTGDQKNESHWDSCAHAPGFARSLRDTLPLLNSAEYTKRHLSWALAYNDRKGVVKDPVVEKECKKIIAFFNEREQGAACPICLGTCPVTFRLKCCTAPMHDTCFFRYLKGRVNNTEWNCPVCRSKILTRMPSDRSLSLINHVKNNKKICSFCRRECEMDGANILSCCEQPVHIACAVNHYSKIKTGGEWVCPKCRKEVARTIIDIDTATIQTKTVTNQQD